MTKNNFGLKTFWSCKRWFFDSWIMVQLWSNFPSHPSRGGKAGKSLLQLKPPTEKTFQKSYIYLINSKMYLMLGKIYRFTNCVVRKWSKLLMEFVYCVVVQKWSHKWPKMILDPTPQARTKNKKLYMPYFYCNHFNK